MANRNLGFISGFPPFSRLAMVITAANLEKTLLLLASVAAFLCLICAHLECPEVIEVKN